ncbi:MAG TPA: hypothetical protein VHF51_17525 [Solirubrobacteraceae bacterium]|jgi:hypothetical protein|nr:hypothetical protein [Solirubrobacteraceae bacterium]
MPTRITFVTGRGFDVEEDIEDVERRLIASDSLLVRFEVSRGGRMEPVRVNPFQIVHLEQT